MIISIVRHIFGIDLLEEDSIFLNFDFLLNEGLLAVYFLDLLRFEVVLALQFCDLGKFLVYVAHLLLKGPQERLILFVYSLGFGFGVFLLLWLCFF